MFISISIKDIIDIILVAFLLYYIFRLMRESRSLNVFIGIMVFIVIWLFVSQVLEMRLLGSILDKLVSVGVLAIIVLFQEEIRKFLYSLGAHQRVSNFMRFFGSKHKNEHADKKSIMPIVMACMNMARQKAGALIVIERMAPLDDIISTAKAGDKTATKEITVKAASSSGDSGSTGGSGSGDSGSTGGSGSGDSGSTGGSGSGDSGSTGGTGEYKVVYEGVPIDEETYTLEEAKALANKYGLAETTDYTIDEANKKIVLTESGKAKVDAAMGGSGEGGETSTTVTANVYNLAALTNEDYVTLGSVIDGAAQQYIDGKGNLKNALKIKALSPAVTLSSGLIVYNSSDNQILVRTTSETVLTPAGAINYGGQSVGDKTNNGTVPANAGDAVTLSNDVKVSRYLAIPVKGGDAASQFKVTVKYKPTNEKGIQIVLVDQNNVMLAKDEENTSKTEKTFVTPAITKGEVTEVRVYLFRTKDATSGGADVSEISIAPVTGE